MESALLAARLLLAAVFAAAGIGKLLDISGSRRALIDFGLRASPARIGAVALPLMELAAAAALVFRPSVRWGAIMALALLLAFIAGIANALIHDRTPDCHCFGQFHSKPAGRETLVRNGALLLVAAIVTWRGPGPAIDAWVRDRTTLELIAAVGVIAGAAITAAMVSSRLAHRTREREEALADSLRRRQGLPIGSAAPRFALPGMDAEVVSLEAVCARGHPVVVLFASLDCCACAQLLPHIARWQATLAQDLTIVVVSAGDPAANRPLRDRYAIADVLLQKQVEVWDAYRMPGTPSAVVVARDGTIASATATGYHMIETLIRLTLRRNAARGGPWQLSIQPA